MDLDKLQKEIAALTAAPATKPASTAKAEPETKQMDAKAFSDYATEQVAKAKEDVAAGRAELGKKRILALKEEVDKVAKFDFKPNELPTVTLYRDPDQLVTTETEVSATATNQPDGRSNWTAKMAGFGKLLAESLEGLTPNTPPGKEPAKKGQEKPATQASSDDDWPSDLAAAIKKSARDDDKDYHWGRDGASAS